MFGYMGTSRNGLEYFLTIAPRELTRERAWVIAPSKSAIIVWRME